MQNWTRHWPAGLSHGSNEMLNAAWVARSEQHRAGGFVGMVLARAGGWGALRPYPSACIRSTRESSAIGKGRRELEQDRLFDLLVAELPASVWEISKLTDVDRHKLSHHWRMMARAYEPQQFHVSRSGLSLLAAYILHLIDVGHTTIQT